MDFQGAMDVYTFHGILERKEIRIGGPGEGFLSGIQKGDIRVRSRTRDKV
jgi:hypothetical protein